MRNFSCRLAAVFFALAAAHSAPLSAQQQAESSNMELVGYNDLQARSAYQPMIQKQGDRWIAYIGHHGGEAMNPLTGKMEANGTSIVDVTDPKHPKYLVHIPGEPKDRAGEIGGASDGARVRRQRSAARRQEQVLSAARFRQQLARNLGRDRSRQAQPHHGGRQRPARHAQELVGMRHRHRLSGLRRSAAGARRA